MQKQNYSIEMYKQMQKIPAGEKLLLHSCCGPCSTSVLETLGEHFEVFLLYYNPNIWPHEEYRRRRDEQCAVLQKLTTKYPVHFKEAEYNAGIFEKAVAGLEDEPEGGRRCAVCFEMRLRQAARAAHKEKIQWFTTTLTVSPHKNAALLNKIGERVAQETGLHFLPSDFKKKEGYKRSLVLSKQLGLYRQDYCGCRYSCLASRG